MMSSGGREVRERGLAGASQLGVGEVVDERVRFAVDDAMALLDDGQADGLREMTFPRAGRPEEQPVLVLSDEASRGELEDEPAVELAVEVEIEGVEGLADIAEAGVLDPALEEPVLATQELVADEGGEEIDRGQRVRLRLEQPRLQAGGHTGAAELAQRALQFDEIHRGISS